MQIFLAGGESRHGLISSTMENGDETILSKPSHVPEIQGGRELAHEAIGGCKDADLSSGEHNLSSLHRSDVIRGGFSSDAVDNSVKQWKPFILESFYYADSETERLLPYFGDFLLDSGAFTFMGGFSFTKSENININWEEYLERYADFINRNRIEKFFELDIDSVVGYEKVKYFRKKLENMTNRQCIPVWHSTRGKEEFLRSCDQYPYVALGGIVGGEWNTKAEKYIPWFIKEAHRRNAKIHGLGYTKLAKLREYHFDSVDSTAWTTGNRFGFIYQFNGKTMIKHNVPKGKRLGDPKKVAMINYSEWIKFQKWAITHL